MSSDQDNHWLGVIGKALGFLCIQNSALKDKTIAQKAVFLDSIGLTKLEIAGMLDSTAASVTELIRQSKSGKANGKKAKKKGSKG